MWIVPRTWRASERSALLQLVGEALGDQAVAARVGVDRVGLEVRVAQHLADDAFLVRQAKFLGDGGIKGRWRDGEAGLRRADEQDRHAAAARELDHLAH